MPAPQPFSPRKCEALHTGRARPGGLLQPCARSRALLPDRGAMVRSVASLRAHWHAVVNAAKRFPLLCSLVAVLAVLSLADVICLIVFFRGGVDHDTFKLELGKALVQFVVVAVIGTLVTGMMFEYQRQRQNWDKEDERERKNRDKEDERERKNRDKEDERERKNRDKEDERERKNRNRREEFLRSILTRAAQAYSNVKKARRLLRARAIVRGEAGGKSAVRKHYDFYLRMIIDAQLELENLAGDIQTSEGMFFNLTALLAPLSEMESYLGKLITEYEKKAFETLHGPKLLCLTDLPQLEGFTATSTEVGDFKKQFSGPYRAIQRAIRRDLLRPNLPNIVSTPA